MYAKKFTVILCPGQFTVLGLYYFFLPASRQRDKLGFGSASINTSRFYPGRFLSRACMKTYPIFGSLANLPVILRGRHNVEIDVSLALHGAKVILDIAVAQNTGLVPQQTLLLQAIVPAHCAINALSVFAGRTYRGWLGITFHRFMAESVL